MPTVAPTVFVRAPRLVEVYQSINGSRGISVALNSRCKRVARGPQLRVQPAPSTDPDFAEPSDFLDRAFAGDFWSLVMTGLRRTSIRSIGYGLTLPVLAAVSFAIFANLIVPLIFAARALVAKAAG